MNEIEFLRLYKELRYLIKHAYKDFQILMNFDNYRRDKELDECQQDLLNHLIFVIQKDFVLTVWKISLDNETKHSASCSHFRNEICHRLADRRIVSKDAVKVKIDPSLKTKLTQVRNQFLAHNDFSREESHTDINIVKTVLDEILYSFNCSCRVYDDSRLLEISEHEIGSSDFSIFLGMGALLREK